MLYSAGRGIYMFGMIIIIKHYKLGIYNNNIYLLKSQIYIQYNRNSGYKWTPQDAV